MSKSFCEQSNSPEPFRCLAVHGGGTFRFSSGAKKAQLGAVSAVRLFVVVKVKIFLTTLANFATATSPTNMTLTFMYKASSS